MKNNLLRHGDLSFTPTNEVPVEAIVRKESNEYVLAWGEATGHAHRLKGKAKVYDLPNEGLILSVEDEAELSHEEHNTIRFPKGLYLLKREREFNYFDAQINQVLD